MRFRSIFFLLILLMFSTKLLAQIQWTGGNITNTYTLTVVGSGQYAEAVRTYSNWVYTDPGGIPHTFSGYTVETQVRTIIMETIVLANVPSSDGLYELNAVGNSGTVTCVSTIAPKYVVVSVMYTPPSTGSWFDYGSGQTLGTATSVESIFENSNTSESDIGYLATSSISTNYSETYDTTTSITVNKTNNFDVKNYSISDLIDHSNDAIIVWINPTIIVKSNENSNNWYYGSDLTDPSLAGDMVTFALHELVYPSTMSAGNIVNSQRAWSPTGALTATDFAQIAASDPFASLIVNGPITAPSTIDPTRFTQQFGQTIDISQITGTVAISQVTSTSNQGQSATNIFAETYSGKITAPGGVFTQSQTLTWTNKVMTTNIVGQTTSASLNIVPIKSPGYSGPTDFIVYRDNIYGTYLLDPAH